MGKCLALLVFFIFGCSHAQKTFSSSLEAKQCIQAKKLIPESQPLNQVTDTATFAAKNIAAYSYIGLNYTAQTLLTVTAATGYIIILCSPAIAVAALSRGSHYYYGPPCLPWPGQTSPQIIRLGKKAIAQTKTLRCPNLEDYSHSLELIADCHADVGDKENISAAILTIDEIQSDKQFESCIDLEYQQHLSEKKEALQRKLSFIP